MSLVDSIIERGPYVGPGALRLDAADLNLLRAELINLRTRADGDTPPATPYVTPDGFPGSPGGLAARLAVVLTDTSGTLDDIDRNARAYGWEVAHRGITPPATVEPSAGNPFTDPAWREWRLPHSFMEGSDGLCNRLDAVKGGGRPRRCGLPEHVGIHGRIPAEWETCAGCKGQFVAGHVCRRHRLCGVCHPERFDNLDDRGKETTQP